MSSETTNNALLSAKVTAEIDKWVKKFPEGRQQSALLPALRFAQEDNGGWLSEAVIKAVAEYLNIPEIAAFEAATFYSMYELKPVGKHKITVCDNVSCQLRGSDQIVKHLEQRLGIKKGQTTADGFFTLKTVECLGACVDAPMMQIDDREFYTKLTPELVDNILEAVEQQENNGG
ncbi:MAG: NADH-quinone oxidoreductase subunit NuoE [Coxiellaceae bacterium]|nr:NADH-quinone oxidoreductase subunit NuoE [Coxiellaceae bacterium]